MSNEFIFGTQIASIIVFVLTLFGIYRSLVSQKDSVIELLREQSRQQENKILELQNQSPDVLSRQLSERVEIALKEIERLSLDGGNHKKEIFKKEKELKETRAQVYALAELIEDSALVCPQCNAPLSTRSFEGLYGPNGEGEAEISYYDCGLTIADGSEMSPCKGKKP
ncbi:hypothetical protein SAMN02745165_03208 [Malonomonas rubra DSM 5091]|uniref:Uncharacterized protein n=1 Tax=Malonomonas rubra DSM 5091 TaxID=1122189 RepID=A0A1M6M7X1_MALRU|nr:hypothetical protein [Malonomonas rubra]SHJ79567.1 hypothetical protein SAMN02745165_03208 [Malonomonas rubra DSM 5091]